MRKEKQEYQKNEKVGFHGIIHICDDRKAAGNNSCYNLTY